MFSCTCNSLTYQEIIRLSYSRVVHFTWNNLCLGEYWFLLLCTWAHSTWYESWIVSNGPAAHNRALPLNIFTLYFSTETAVVVVFIMPALLSCSSNGGSRLLLSEQSLHLIGDLNVRSITGFVRRLIIVLCLVVNQLQLQYRQSCSTIYQPEPPLHLLAVEA